MKSKKGASPLIATVLIIALTVALMNWAFVWIENSGQFEKPKQRDNVFDGKWDCIETYNPNLLIQAIIPTYPEDEKTWLDLNLLKEEIDFSGLDPFPAMMDNNMKVYFTEEEYKLLTRCKKYGWVKK